ncbi:unnamed protein product [Closterium sp. NIES-64]|nr:unnamed protein product [Closterium sp. NIES-64]
MLLVDPSCPSSLLISVDLPRSLASLLLSSLPLLIGSALSLALCTSSYLFSHSLSHSSSPSLHTLPSLLSLIASSPWPSFSSPVPRSLLSSLIIFSLLHSLSHSSHFSLPLSHSHPLESPPTHSGFSTLQVHSAASSSSHPLPLYHSLLSPLLLFLPSLPRLSPSLTSFLHTLTSSLHSSLHSTLPSSLRTLLPSSLQINPNRPHHATSFLLFLASARCMLSCIFSTLTSALVSILLAVVISSAILCLLVALLKVTLSIISWCGRSRFGVWEDEGTNIRMGYWPALLFLFPLLPLALFSPFLALLLAAAVQITRASQAKTRTSLSVVSELLLADALLLLVTALFHLPPFIALLHAKASLSMAPFQDILPSIASLLLIVTPPLCSSQNSPTLPFKPTVLQQVVFFVCYLCGVASFVFSLYLVLPFCLNVVAVVAVSRFVMYLPRL